MRTANGRPDPVRPEPVLKVRDELESLPPGQDAAGFENSAALLVDGPVVLPVLRRVEAPIVAAVPRRSVHGVGKHGVDGGGGNQPQQGEGIAVEDVVDEWLDA